MGLTPFPAGRQIENVIDYSPITSIVKNAHRNGSKAMKLRTAAIATALIWSVNASAQDMKAEVIHWWTSGG